MVESLNPKNRACWASSSEEVEPMQMRLKEGRWYAAIKHNGKYIGVSLKAKEHEDNKARKNLGKLLEKLERGENPGRDSRKFKTLIPDYRELISHRSESYQIRHEAIIKNLVEFFGDRKIDSIKGADVIEFKLQRERVGSKRDTIRKELYALRRIMNLIFKDWNIPSMDPRKEPAMEFFNQGKIKTRFLEKHEFDLILAHADEWLKPIIMVAALTGLRMSNVLNLCWSQINMQHGLIQVGKTKNGKSIRVHISDGLMDILRYLDRIRFLHDDRVFRYEGQYSARKERVSRAFKRAWRNACKVEKIPWTTPQGPSFHDLRHAFCSWLANAGVDIGIIQELAGHSSTNVTKRYVHFMDDILFSAVDLLDQRAPKNGCLKETPKNLERKGVSGV